VFIVPGINTTGGIIIMITIVIIIKPFSSIIDSRVRSRKPRILAGRIGSGHDFRGTGRVLKFGPACNSELILSATRMDHQSSFDLLV